MKDHLVNVKDYLDMARREAETCLAKSTPIQSIVVMDIIRGLASVKADLDEALDALRIGGAL